MIDISLSAAFLAGLLSFLSPCVLPLVPPYLVYLTGASMEELSGGEDGSLTRRTVQLAALFVLGFATIFVLLGASAWFLGALLRAWSGPLSTLAGILIVVMGLHFIGLFRLPWLMGTAKLEVMPKAGPVGAYVMGLAFAFGWTPCIGPVLAGILAVAASRDSAGQGALMLGVYSAGLGVPFLLAALMVRPFMGFMQRFRRHIRVVEIVMGVLLVLTGIAFLTGGMATAAFYLLEAFPVLGRLG